MDVLKSFYELAEARNIHIDNFRLTFKPAMCYLGKCGQYSIAVDYSQIHTLREEKQVIAEELSHCEYNLMYKLKDYGNPLYKQNAKQTEYRARRYGAKKLVPLPKLKEALKKNLDTYELSELFNVDEAIIQLAIDSYVSEGLI